MRTLPYLTKSTTMSYFSYKGRNNKGELVQGVLNSPSSGALANQLMQMGIIPIEIVPTTAPTEPKTSRQFFEERVEPLDLMMFSRQMSSLLKAGVPIFKALNALHSSTKNPALTKIIKQIIVSLDSGHELSNALALYPSVFNKFYVSMIRVGESTGMLDIIFLRLFEHLEFEKFMRDQIKSALRYPSFVITAMAIAMVILNIFVIPVFANMFKNFGAELPLVTQILLGFSHFMITSWPYLLGSAIGSVYGFRRYTHTANGKLRWDRYKLKIPIAGKIIYKATMARFTRSFAIASKSGIPILSTLNLVANTVENEFIGQKILAMEQGIERGESILRTANNTGVFNALVLQMIAVGEESGSLDNMMGEVADMYQRDVEYEIKTLGTQIEPILISFLGVMVLILALGIFLPMWDLGKVAIHHSK